MLLFAHLMVCFTLTVTPVDTVGSDSSFVAYTVPVDSLRSLADRSFDAQRYLRAAVFYGQLYARDSLDAFGLFRYAVCLNINGDYPRALRVINQIDDYDYFEQRAINIYGVIGNIYRYNDRLEESIEYFRLAVARFPEQSLEETASIFGCLGEVYSELGDHSEAMEYFKSALRYREIFYNLPEGYLMRDCLGQLSGDQESYRSRTDLIDYEVYNYLNERQLTGATTLEELLPTVAQLAGRGNIYAQKRCYADGLEFYVY